MLRNSGHDPALLDNFGNFHFGIVAAAYGFNLESAMYGAGHYQITQQGGGNLGHFVSATNIMIYTGGGYMFPDSFSRYMASKGFTWGDNPGDSINLMKGWDYYDSRK